MFGTSVSHDWDTIAFGLSTIPGIATLLLVAAGYWEQWRRRLSMPRTESSETHPFATDFATGTDAKEIAA